MRTSGLSLLTIMLAPWGRLRRHGLLRGWGRVDPGSESLAPGFQAVKPRGRNGAGGVDPSPSARAIETIGPAILGPRPAPRHGRDHPTDVHKETAMKLGLSLG